MEAKKLWQADLSWTEIAERLHTHFPGCSLYQARERIRHYMRRQPEYKAANSPKTADYHTTTFNGDGSIEQQKVIKIKRGVNMTKEFLLKAHGFDPLDWQVRTCTNNFYEMQKAGGDTLLLYQSKLIAEPRKAGEVHKEEVFEWFKGFEETYRPPINRYTKPKGNYLLEVAPLDTHIGKLAWGMESGENYDQKIAYDRLISVIDDVISRVKEYPIEQIIYPNLGNDFYNSDTPLKTTTAGTPQDTDIRWQKLFFKGMELSIEVIDKLAQVAPVKALYIPGNHDETTSYYLAVALQRHFQNYPNVEIDISPKTRKYIEYGNTLIGYTHGDWDKARLHDVMPVEAREAWGRTLYHEMHAGHLHKEQTTRRNLNLTEEESGVIVRRLPSISATDAWHAKMGYVGTVKKAQNFLYEKDKGLVKIINSVV